MIARKNIVVSATNFFWICAVIVCGAVMFYVSLEARHAEEQLYRTYAEIEKEEENIRVLKIEIAYLTRPDYLQNLAQKHLPLKLIQAAQFGNPEEIENRPENTPDLRADAQKEDVLLASIAPSAGEKSFAVPFSIPARKPKKEETHFVSRVEQNIQIEPTKTDFSSLLQTISSKRN